MMVPNVKITGGILDAVFVYVAILGILLVVGTIIRLKVPVLKKYHIPASLVAGIIGLMLGPYFLKVIPANIMNTWSALAGRLIVVIFTPMLMGNAVLKNKSIFKKAMGAVCYSYAVCAAQYAIPLILSLLVLIPVFNVNPLFSVIVEEGWIGGHGTSGGMALVFEELKWMDGQTLSITSATVGLLWGVISGMVLINIAARKGWTRFLHNTTSLKNDEKELYSLEERPVAAKATINNGVIDPMAFHLAIISIAMFIGWLGTKAIKMYCNISVSWFVTAMFAGLLVKLVLDRTSWNESLDKGTISRIQGVCLEFLVAGAVASVNVSVVISYAWPLIIQQGAVMLIMTFFATWYCRRMFGEYWFENSMVCYGTFCGVFATGMLLLKTCDPELKSDALEVYAVRTPFASWAVGGGIITGMMPYWVVQYGTATMAMVATVVMIIALILPRIFGCWTPVKEN